MSCPVRSDLAIMLARINARLDGTDRGIVPGPYAPIASLLPMQIRNRDGWNWAQSSATDVLILRKPLAMTFWNFRESCSQSKKFFR